MERMAEDESLRRWRVVKMFCESCPKHGVSDIVTHRNLAINNAVEIYTRDGRESQAALSFIEECGNCKTARAIIAKLESSLPLK
jgi:hypothetical protein